MSILARIILFVVLALILGVVAAILANAFGLMEPWPTVFIAVGAVLAITIEELIARSRARPSA